MRYVLLLYLSDRPKPGTPAGDAMFGAVRAFHAHCAQEGALVASAPLRDPDTAVTLRERGASLLRTDGPFAETTEWLAGYFILDCRDHEQALRLAASCPTASSGSVELRPIMDLVAPPQIADPGAVAPPQIADLPPAGRRS